MRTKGLFHLLAVFFLILPQLLDFAAHFSQQEVIASEEIYHDDKPRFLITPYYDTEFLRSFFDHELPNGNEDGYIRKYNEVDRLSGAGHYADRITEVPHPRAAT